MINETLSQKLHPYSILNKYKKVWISHILSVKWTLEPVCCKKQQKRFLTINWFAK